MSQGGVTTKSRTQVRNAPTVTEESENRSTVTNAIFDMQASITEHGTLLKEKEGKKVATTLIKDCIEEVTSATKSTKMAWKTEMEEHLAATRATKSPNKAVETRIKMEYDKLFKALRTMQSYFTRQGIAKCGSPSDATEGNYVQKITRMLTLTTDHFESDKAHCTRTKEEVSCVKTRSGRLIAEMRDVTAKKHKHKRIDQSNKRSCERGGGSDLEVNRRQTPEYQATSFRVARVATATQTQMNAMAYNLSHIMTLIAAGISRGNELIRDLLPQNTTVENGNWTYEKIAEDRNVQKSNACDVRHT